jgi:hypothetical protein
MLLASLHCTPTGLTGAALGNRMRDGEGEPQEGHVAADPMTCRGHANVCLRLAEIAKTSELSTALLSMAQSWARLADDTERYETVLLGQCETEPCIGATPRAVEVWLEAGL